MSVASTIKDVFWPRTCAVRDCGRRVESEEGYICSRCRASLPWYDEVAKSAFAYLEPIAGLINSFKFFGAVHLAEDFAEALETTFRKKHDAADVDVVMPVPLHPKRLSERGYNQAALMAERFAARLGRLYDGTTLAKVRHTEHQSRSSEEERRRNLKGAFRVIDPTLVRGRSIVLVDDVLTTGSTMDECTAVLKAAGAYKVQPYVLAKALMDEDLGEDYIG